MSENKTITSLNQLKNWFKTGLKPTQAHFWAWLDSFYHKGEEIPQDKISGLAETLENKAETSDLEAKANADATGLSEEQKQAWKEALEVGELPTNIALIDESGDDGNKQGNVYTKEQITELLENSGKNLGNTDLRVPEGTVRTLDVTGAKMQVQGLLNKKSDASFTRKLVTNDRGEFAYTDKEDIAFTFPENFSATLTVNHIYPTNIPPRPAFADDLRRILENYRSYQFTPITQNDWTIKTKENKGLSSQVIRTDNSVSISANHSDFNSYPYVEEMVSLTTSNVVLPKNQDWILKIYYNMEDIYHGGAIKIGIAQGDVPMGIGVRGTDYATTGFISNQSKKVSGRSHILTLIIKTGDIVTIFNYTNGNVAYHSQSIMPEFGDFSPKVSLSRGSSFNGTMEYKML